MNNVKGFLIVLVFASISLAILYSPWLSPGLYEDRHYHSYSRSVAFGERIENATASFSASKNVNNQILPTISPSIIGIDNGRLNSKHKVVSKNYSANTSKTNNVSNYSVQSKNKSIVSNSTESFTGTLQNVSQGTSTRSNNQQNSGAITQNFTQNFPLTSKDRKLNQLNAPGLLDNGLIQDATVSAEDFGPQRGSDPGPNPTDPPIPVSDSISIIVLIAAIYSFYLAVKRRKQLV